LDEEACIEEIKALEPLIIEEEEKTCDYQLKLEIKPFKEI
jgi:hypothetical protein